MLALLPLLPRSARETPIGVAHSYKQWEEAVQGMAPLLGPAHLEILFFHRCLLLQPASLQPAAWGALHLCSARAPLLPVLPRNLPPARSA